MRETQPDILGFDNREWEKGLQEQAAQLTASKAQDLGPTAARN